MFIISILAALLLFDFFALIAFLISRKANHISYRRLRHEKSLQELQRSLELTLN